MRTSRILSLLVAAASIGSVGCSSAPAYVHPNADFSSIHRIAILPFDNLTTERFAGERIREVLTVEVLRDSPFEVAESGLVNRALRQRSLTEVSALGPDDISALGKELGVQALMFGSVVDYHERRSGNLSMPEVALTLRLVDVESGTSLWSVSDAHTGASFWTRLFGVGEESLTEAVQLLVRDLLKTIG